MWEERVQSKVGGGSRGSEVGPWASHRHTDKCVNYSQVDKVSKAQPVGGCPASKIGPVVRDGEACLSSLDLAYRDGKISVHLDKQTKNY